MAERVARLVLPHDIQPASPGSSHCSCGSLFGYSARIGQPFDFDADEDGGSPVAPDTGHAQPVVGAPPPTSTPKKNDPHRHCPAGHKFWKQGRKKIELHDNTYRYR